MRELVTGFFGQELKVGDHIVMSCSSYSRHYMREAHIHSITYETKSLYNYKTGKRQSYETPVVKIVYKKMKRKWSESGWTDLGVVDQVSRVYNWKSAITLP